MQFLFAVLVVLVSAVYVANGLECYLCVGSATGDCFDAKLPALIKQKCPDEGDGPRIPDGHKMASLNDKYKGQKVISVCSKMAMTLNGTTIFSRGCGRMYEKGDLCEFITALAEKVENCKSCNTELCNNVK